MQETKILASYCGGSRLYGLANENSDYDERHVFINTDPAYILGMFNNEKQVTNNKEEDIVSYEVRYFFELMQKCSLNVLEPLFCSDDDFTVLSDEFKEIRCYRNEFIDSQKLHKAVAGFVHHQIKLGFDDGNNRQEGSLRDLDIEKYGFRGKPLVHALRSLESATAFCYRGIYIVKPKKNLELCLSIKNNPENHNAKDIRKEIQKQLDAYYAAYDDNRLVQKFNHTKANELLLEFYKPYLIRAF